MSPYLRFDGNNFDRVGDSKYGHRYTSLGSYQGRPFVTGGYQNPDGKTEILSTNSLKWESGPDYPFMSDDVYRMGWVHF